MALIEREALKKHAIYLYGFGAYKYVPLKVIEQAPTISAAPVVHCKDCQYFRPDDPNGEPCANISGMTEPDEDDYCSRWSARMDGGEGNG